MYTVIISCSYNHLATLPSHPKCHLYTPHLAKRKPFKESLWLSSVMIWLLMEIVWRVWRWLWNSVLWWERPLGWKLIKLDMFFCWILFCGLAVGIKTQAKGCLVICVIFCWKISRIWIFPLESLDFCKGGFLKYFRIPRCFVMFQLCLYVWLLNQNKVWS